MKRGFVLPRHNKALQRTRISMSFVQDLNLAAVRARR